MTPQYTYDTYGRPIGVFLPIEDWDLLRNKYLDFDNGEIAQWHKEILDKRVEILVNNPNDVTPLDEFLKEMDETV